MLYTPIYTVVISYKGEAITACTCLANGRVLSSKKNFSFYSRPPRGSVLSSLFFSSISAVCSISFHFGLSYLHSLFPGKKEKIRPSRQITFDRGRWEKFFFLFSIQTWPLKINCVRQLYCPWTLRDSI